MRSLKNKENIFFTKKVIYDDKEFLSIIILSLLYAALMIQFGIAGFFSKMINFFPKIKVLKNRKKTKTIRKKNERKKNLMEKNLFLKIMIKYL